MPEIEDYHFQGSQRDNFKRRLSSLFQRLGPRKTGGLFLTLLVMLALPITLIAVQQRQNVRQHAAEGDCLQTVLEPTGMAGRDPQTNEFYKPSAIVMEPNHRVYVFLIGDGGPQSGKPMGDWYNLYVIDGDVHNGSISWTDYGGTIFRNMGGILSSSVRTYRDGQGIHVYVNGLDTATNTPRGEYMSIIEVDNNIIPWTDQLDGNQGNARQSSEVDTGATFKFSTDGGPLSGCLTERREGIIGGRNGIVDRPDETNENQFKVLYVIPLGGVDHEYDLNGAIERSIKEQQKWLAAKTNGYQIRFDTYDGGKLDIGYVRLAMTGNEIVGYNPNDYGYAHSRIASNLIPLGFNLNDKPNKRYAVYYDGDSMYACGDSFSPGVEAIIYLQGHNRRDNALCAGHFPLNGLPGMQKSAETLLLHEMFHTMGAVDERAPHSDAGAHISIPDGSESENDIARDVMYSGSRGLNPSAIDIHNDDYFLLSNSELRDVTKSGFMFNDTNLSRPRCEPFLDICDYGEETKKAIACLSSQFGVVRGYNDGRFGGEDTIIRGTYVAFLVRYRRDVLKEQDWIDDFNTIDSYYDSLPEANSGAAFGQKKFSDIDKSNPLWKEIYLSQKKGFILGYQDGEFKPNEKWFFGFHGITRDDNFRGEGYNFTGPSEVDQIGITRASFITNLYQYSLDRNRDKLNGCSL